MAQRYTIALHEMQTLANACVHDDEYALHMLHAPSPVALHSLPELAEARKIVELPLRTETRIQTE
jgi:hypothetical protein